MTPEAADFLRLAKEAVRSSEGGLRQQDYPGFLISRAYYAMFYAATALLQNDGKSFSSHAAVISCFGKDYAHPGKLPAHLHRSFLDASRERNLGDYDPRAGLELTEAQAEQTVNRAKEFVIACEKALHP